jgi:hypothetical protein
VLLFGDWIRLRGAVHAREDVKSDLSKVTLSSPPFCVEVVPFAVERMDGAMGHLGPSRQRMRRME